MATSKIKTMIENDIHNVWETILDVENYPNWRSDLSTIQRMNEKQFIEYSKDGYPTTFTITFVEPYKRWEFDIENSNIKGHWIGLFHSKGNKTEVAFTEFVTVKKFYMKPFIKAYLKKQQTQFIDDLVNALI